MWIFTLAERLGKPVEELLDSVTVLELLEWIAFDRIREDPMAFASMDDRIKHFMRKAIEHGTR